LQEVCHWLSCFPAHCACVCFLCGRVVASSLVGLLHMRKSSLLMTLAGSRAGVIICQMCETRAPVFVRETCSCSG
jgi:hypothetical protein